MQKMTETEGFFIRINYDDGDVLDQKQPSGALAHRAAASASLNLKASVDVCYGADVKASYRDGVEV